MSQRCLLLVHWWNATKDFQGLSMKVPWFTIYNCENERCHWRVCLIPLARGRGVEELPIGVGDSRQLGEFLSSNKSNISLYCSTLGCGGACGCALRHADVSQGMTRHSVLHKAQFACCFIERELIYLTWSLIVYWLTKWTIRYYGGWKKSCTSW